MLILSNSTNQLVPPGQALTFDTEILHIGRCECHEPGSGSATLRRSNALYEVNVSGNIGATTAGPAELTIYANGAPVSKTTMISTTAAADDLNSVAKTRTIATCCGPKTLSIVNTGTTDVTVDTNILFSIKHVI